MRTRPSQYHTTAACAHDRLNTTRPSQYHTTVSCTTRPPHADTTVSLSLTGRGLTDHSESVDFWILSEKHSPTICYCARQTTPPWVMRGAQERKPTTSGCRRELAKEPSEDGSFCSAKAQNKNCQRSTSCTCGIATNDEGQLLFSRAQIDDLLLKVSPTVEEAKARRKWWGACCKVRVPITRPCGASTRPFHSVTTVSSDTSGGTAHGRLNSTRPCEYHTTVSMRPYDRLTCTRRVSVTVQG